MRQPVIQPERFQDDAVAGRVAQFSPVRLALRAVIQGHQPLRAAFRIERRVGAVEHDILDPQARTAVAR